MTASYPQVWTSSPQMNYLVCEECAKAVTNAAHCDACGDVLCEACQHYDEGIVFCFVCWTEREEEEA